MRIARVLTRLNLGGPARQVLASDPLLVQRGHDVRVLTGTPAPGEGDLFDALTTRGLDVVRVPALVRRIAPVKDLFAARELRRELSAFRPDVLHTHASKAGYLGRRALRRSPDAERVARVHTFHGHVLEGYFGPGLSRRLIAVERELAAETDRIVAVSHATADDLVRLGVAPEEKLVVVQPGIDLAPFLELPRGESRDRGELRGLIGAGPDDVVVGVVGRLAAVKRPELALDVFELLAAQHPGLHLAFVGDGEERRGLERRIGGLSGPGAERVHLLGAREDMPVVLADLDAVLLTSRSEGLPVALVEAAAAGLPVVATAVGGVEEVVAHERTGFLGTSAEELAYGLATLLGDAEERRAMGERARLRVARRHAAGHLADRLEELYRVVVEERARARETA
jgi:glycosyltransferase involved in cell wall biosynthesis